MKQKLIKYGKIAGVVALVAFMFNTLMMLGELKKLDSQLSQNSKLLGKAIAYENAMGQKSESIEDMVTEFDAIMAKMKSVHGTAGEIVGNADQIKAMNDSLLSVNQAIDAVIVANIEMAGAMTARMGDVVSIMGNAGGLLAEIGAAAKEQLGKVAQMRDLAAANNNSVPALP